jgi:hypothetical protein
VAVQDAVMVLDTVWLDRDLIFRLPMLTSRDRRATRSKKMARLW